MNYIVFLNLEVCMLSVPYLTAILSAVWFLDLMSLLYDFWTYIDLCHLKLEPQKNIRYTIITLHLNYRKGDDETRKTWPWFYLETKPNFWVQVYWRGTLSVYLLLKQRTKCPLTARRTMVWFSLVYQTRIDLNMKNRSPSRNKIDTGTRECQPADHQQLCTSRKFWTKNTQTNPAEIGKINFTSHQIACNLMFYLHQL